MIQFELKNLDKIKRALDKLAFKDARNAITNANGEAARLVRNDAKRRVPVRTGRLRKSIKVKKLRTTPTRVRHSVGWDRKVARHGHLIEFGHSKRGGGSVAAQPHIRPAGHENKDLIRNVFVKRLRKEIIRRR